MKSDPQIRIKRLRVRLPGASKETGYALAQALREQLGHLPAGTAPAHIGALRLRIPGPPSADPSDLSAAIATTISSKLARPQSHPHA